MSTDIKWVVAPDAKRDEYRSRKGQWKPAWAAVEAGKTIFVGGEHAKVADSALRYHAAKSGRVLRSHRHVEDGQEGVLLWLDEQ